MSTVPKEPGYYWAKWRIADDGTSNDEDITPSTSWCVVEVFMTCLDKNDPDYLMVAVPRVQQIQSIINFVWGEGPLKQPKDRL